MHHFERICQIYVTIIMSHQYQLVLLLTYVIRVCYLYVLYLPHTYNSIIEWYFIY